MQTDITQCALTVGEYEAAQALGLSVHTLRKDRQSSRRIPFFKIGSAVRYNLDRVREALTALEVGGPAPHHARRRG
jgi:hypothetical protein